MLGGLSEGKFYHYPDSFSSAVPKAVSGSLGLMHGAEKPKALGTEWQNGNNALFKIWWCDNSGIFVRMCGLRFWHTVTLCPEVQPHANNLWGPPGVFAMAL